MGMKRGRAALDGQPMAAVPTRFLLRRRSGPSQSLYPEMVSQEEREELVTRVGLCAGCQFVRRMESDRGSVFYMCQRSATDPSFPKYPRLPVLQCAGYDPVDSSILSK